MMLRSAFLFLGLALNITTSSVVDGQTTRPVPAHPAATKSSVSGTRKYATVPFGVREKATYKVSFGGIGVGNGSSEVASIDTIRGVPAYHFVFKMKGGMIFAHVDDTQESWMDVGALTSLRFHQNIQEVKYKRLLTTDMFPGESIWKSVNHLRATTDPKREETGRLASTLPLDDISFMYWARTIPLEVGKTYSFTRYFKEDGNPVVVKVLRRETVKVPAGTFHTIVIQPSIKTKGLFSEGGEAELYFTDDDRRMLVMLNSKLSIGSLKLQLQSYVPGEQQSGKLY
jgi:hypothetical protein